MMTNQPTHKAKTLDGTWIEGWYDGSTGAIMWITDNKIPCVSIKPNTLCRSTYRTDSNGKMMYEGDEVYTQRGVYIIWWNPITCAFLLTNDHENIFMGTVAPTLTGKNKHD
jgi:hypothetical protein